MKQTIKLTESELNNIIKQCTEQFLNEGANEGKIGDWFRKTFGKKQNKKGTGTGYSRIQQAYDPFSAPKQHQTTPEEQQAIDKANSNIVTFEATQRVMNALRERQKYQGYANKCYAQAQNLCKQYHLNLGQIMQSMGMSNATVKKYQQQQYNSDWTNAMNSQEAMDEEKK